MAGSQIERAKEPDADDVARLINVAFTVESWFVDGDRISPREIRRLMAGSSGVFLVAREGGTLIGCVYAERRAGGRGYIGLLAVAPSAARSGLGSGLLRAAEEHLSDAACCAIDITVVNLRTELFPFYERRGYRVGAPVPFPRDAKLPCHLVTMTKTFAR